MQPKPQNPVKQMFVVKGPSVLVSDFRGKAYETITLNPDYTVTEEMAPGYVPNAMMDEKADMLVVRLRVFAMKHKDYTPDPSALVALFVQGNQYARNPARRVVEMEGKKRK